MLTALCILYDEGKQLPENRLDLYKRIVNRVLYHRYPGDAHVREPIRRRLEAIALGMHTGTKDESRRTPVTEISWIEIERLLANFANLNPEYEADQVEAAGRREDLLNNSGLLVPRPNERAAFYHLSFQELLAALCLVRKPANVEQVFVERSEVKEWRPTLVFLFSAQIAARDAQWGMRLLKRLIEEQQRAKVKTNPAPSEFIAEALDLYMANGYSVWEDLKKDFYRLSLEAIEDEVELQVRQALGLCLGRLGDPRIRALRDPSAYVEVPAGTYPYGDRGQRIEITRPFRISRYPVTNSQYKEFMDEGGYRDPNHEWWSPEGLAWLNWKRVTEPAYLSDRRWNGPNQPVVGVSFWEAEACCKWAGGRLPSEQEWEAAGRGPEGFRYPWGNDWQYRICNTAEAGLGRTSPVGLFPRARQARLGIEDLSGNVREWCANLYDRNLDYWVDVSRLQEIMDRLTPSPSRVRPRARDFYNAIKFERANLDIINILGSMPLEFMYRWKKILSSNVPRVLRGGSWYYDRSFANLLSVLKSDPRNRYNSVGFRVVLSREEQSL